MSFSTAGLDYSPLMDTKISFLPGETTAVVRVHIVDDHILETAETFSVSLTESNIAVNGSVATVSILDVDG